MERGLPLQYREAAEELRSLFGVVAEKFRHPIIIAMKGHPCTGRRLFAFWLAATLRCPLIKEDDIRNSSTEQSTPSLPSMATEAVEEIHQISYQGVCRIAVFQLEFGLSVVIDSELCCQSQFDQLKSLADWTKTPIVIFECTQPRNESELWRSLEQLEDVDFASRWWDKPSSMADLRRLLDDFNTHSEFDVADDIPKFAVDITPAEDMKKWVSYALQSIVTHVESGHNQAQKKKCDCHTFKFWDEQENNQARCVECLQHISGPIYRCINCNFIFHKSCTRLPSMMEFCSNFRFIKKMEFSHCSEVLYLRNAKNPERENRCDFCHKILKGCFYGFDYVLYRLKLTFHFDLDCIFLPFKRRVKFHEHQLELCFNLDFFNCDACGIWTDYGICYSCPDCQFMIDRNCAWLPETAVYERHRHPFKLSLSPRDDSDQYYCNACEKKGTQNTGSTTAPTVIFLHIHVSLYPQLCLPRNLTTNSQILFEEMLDFTCLTGYVSPVKLHFSCISVFVSLYPILFYLRYNLTMQTQVFAKTNLEKDVGNNVMLSAPSKYGSVEQVWEC